MTDQLEISCESCGAKILFEPYLRTARCPYCDSPSVVDRPATGDRPDPVFAIGFEIDRNQAIASVRQHVGRKKFAPAGITTAATERVRGIYVPTYLYSAQATSAFSARIGEDYYVREIGTDSKGRPTVKKKRRTEYLKLDGTHECYIGDVLVTASRGIPNDEVEWLEPYDLGRLRRYSTGLVSGWISEEPSMAQSECLELARRESRSAVGRKLRQFMPGDSFSGLRHQTGFDAESIDLTLMPVWVVALRWHERKPPIRILVNGQTGEVVGKIPTSWAKIAILIAAVLGLLAIPGLIGLLLGLLR
jgi:hypothetical protein